MMQLVPKLLARATRSSATTMRLLLLCQLALGALLTSPAALAQTQTSGDYTVHYIAVNSTFISPQIAQQYDIERNRRGAFLNIAVLKNNADGSTTPVTAQVSGGKQNLMQQRGDIDFREVREGTAIYYLGQFEFSNAELLRFSVDVQPEGQGPAHHLEWTTTLYAD